MNDPLAFIGLAGFLEPMNKDFAAAMARQAAVLAEMVFQTEVAERRHAAGEGLVIDGECVDLDRPRITSINETGRFRVRERNVHPRYPAAGYSRVTGR